ncbi:hypothetical protein FRB93_006937 [Tulasnella sp. JGI-2019a]|nr:hypothetical protein FRB93_006937 [Tulasnella sp. JGI-2019a]
MVDGTIRSTISDTPLTSSDPSIQLDTFSSVANAMQLLLAMARLDMGNVFPNNILVNPGTIDATIIAYGRLYHDFHNYNGTLNLNTTRPAVIASQYLCHFPQRKSLGSAIVSVMVATLSMFGMAG